MKRTVKFLLYYNVFIVYKRRRLMDHNPIEPVMAVIAYVESHLNEHLNLETVAKEAHYSKYHLHRMFTAITGITLHDYIRRRQLTEAAKHLVFSRKSILDIALTADYESQQAFTDVFKSMYKQTPLEYREKENFYPLQLEFALNSHPAPWDAMSRTISYATFRDIPAWMDFVSLVIDGFPCFDEAEHIERLKRCVRHRQALIMKDNNVIAGAAAFSPGAGSIDFFGVHPQYRRHKIAETLLDFLICNVFTNQEISITTFRQGDKADMGQRRMYQGLGFKESELLTEFGYPAQRLILPPRRNA